MGNAYFAAGDAEQRLGPSSVRDDEDDGWDAEVGTGMESLLEENARLRALVVQLSKLVLNASMYAIPVHYPIEVRLGRSVSAALM